jgi:hypothetical protein
MMNRTCLFSPDEVWNLPHEKCLVILLHSASEYAEAVFGQFPLLTGHSLLLNEKAELLLVALKKKNTQRPRETS